jgi:hypothetical protein
MTRIQELIRLRCEGEGKPDKSLGCVRAGASSTNNSYALLFEHLAFLFRESWLITYQEDDSTGFPVTCLGWTPIEKKSRNTWTKKRLAEALGAHRFIDKLPDSFEFVLPPGMTIATQSLSRYPGDKEVALIFEDRYCRVKFLPGGNPFHPITLTDEYETQKLFVQGRAFTIAWDIKGWWVGSTAAAERKTYWLQPLLESIDREFPGIPASWIKDG